MESKKFTITIVGGGTSGWITAALLRKNLGAEVEIRLFESEDIGIIGVGESTVPTLRTTLLALGIEEKEFLKRCQGTFKMGLKLVNWKKPKDGHAHRYFHSFGPVAKIDGVPISEFWLRWRQLGATEPFDFSCYMNPWFCEARRSPKFTDTPPYQGIVDYTYQVDAALLARYLRELSVSWGVLHQTGQVREVKLKADGAIDYLLTDSQTQLKADLFVDCTGFQGLLINQALGEPFVPYAGSLLCDRAVAMIHPRASDETHINPFTTATALSSGWIWNIPLQTRDGTGYVYSSAFLSSDAAEQEFRAFLGKDAQPLPAKQLQMRIGRNRHSWVKNCLAVGLASGFIEPLESSGIGFIYIAVQKVLSFIADYARHPEKVAEFNEYIADLFDLIRDFIILHYCLTDRDDTPFWQANQHELKIPDHLRDNLEKWREQFPQEDMNSGLVALYDYKIVHILAGMGYLPARCHPRAANDDVTKLNKMFNHLRGRAASFAEHLPDHGESIREIVEK